MDTLLASISEATYIQYQTALRRWGEFCITKNLDPWAPSAKQVLNFLQYILSSSRVAYATINTYRSALSLITQEPLGRDATLNRFLKGVANLRPPAPRYEDTWDPQVVLRHLDRPITELPDLSAKLVTLLLLATGQRLQTVAAIKLKEIHYLPEFGIKIFVSGRLKTSGPNRFQPCLLLPFFQNRPNLCVASLLKQYLEKTASLRPTYEPALFIISRNPYSAASRQTLSKWVTGVLREAGVSQLFKTHSTRHAAVSAASRAGAPLQTIFKAAGWSPTSAVFAAFYNRPLADQTPLLPHVFNTSTT